MKKMFMLGVAFGVGVAAMVALDRSARSTAESERVPGPNGAAVSEPRSERAKRPKDQNAMYAEVVAKMWDLALSEDPCKGTAVEELMKRPVLWRFARNDWDAAMEALSTLRPADMSAMTGDMKEMESLIDSLVAAHCGD